MQFNSLYFILFFLPLTMAAWYLAGRKSGAAAQWILILASVIFYGSVNVWYPVMLGVLVLVNWGIVQQLRRERAVSGAAAGTGSSRKGKVAPDGPEEAANFREDGQQDKDGQPSLPGKHWMILGVVLNAAILGVFKYTDFFIENLNTLFRTDWTSVNLILPLGISFIIFSQISWIVDSYRGQTEDVCLREYLLFSSFFPKISEGPIVLMRDFLPQLRREDLGTFRSDNLAVGIQMFVCGLGKKILLADVLGTAVDWYYDTILYRTNVESLLILIVYTFQIYFDFSGYSDMALGLCRMLGIELPANFNSPYKACTVTDFWRRWHISLTTFLREYIYYPLGGSRKGKFRTCCNIMIIYLISGLWHGASWSYVLWGLLHGAAQILERLAGGLYLKVWKPVRWFITMAFVGLMWMIFRSGTWAGVVRYHWHLIIETTWGFSMEFAENFLIPGMAGMLRLAGLPSGTAAAGMVSMVLILALCFFLCLCCPNNQERQYHNSALSVVVTAAMLGLCLLNMSGVSSFIYNDF